MRSRYVLATLAALLAVLPARSCGPDWPVAVFTKLRGPDQPYAAFAKGQLGVLQPGYRVRNLVVAYDYLTGRPLSTSEQEQAVAVNKNFIDYGWGDVNRTPPGLAAWIKARVGFGKVDAFQPTADLATEHLIPGQNYEFFTNCLDAAFKTAAETLQARAAAHGPANPEVVEWIRGQDAVFSNCGTPPQYVQGKRLPPPPTAMPSPLQHASPWLQKDRAYQLAAASFYAVDYPTAIARFNAIAADSSSPWSMLARYLVARTLIRRALIEDGGVDAYYRNSGENAAHAKFLVDLGQVQKELLVLNSDPRMAPMYRNVDALLDFVNSMLQPEQQSIVLAGRLRDPHRGDFGQSLTDLTIIRTTDELDSPQRKAERQAARSASKDSGAVDMLDWIDTLQSQNSAHALKRWQATQKSVWLVAAITLAKPGDPSAERLVDAALAVSPSDAAFIGLTYHRLRLTLQGADTRTQLLALTPSINRQGPSTRNLFATLSADTANDLDTWLTQVGRLPASELEDGSEDNVPGSSYGEDGPVPVHRAKELPLFTAAGATILNTRLPLRLLAEAATSPSLPANLRAEVAQAAWTRAVLLDRPDVARRMSPILIADHSIWQPVLDAYDHAATDDDRHAAGLFALMRFASTEPNVREGYPRPDGFASYSSYRDNWWASTIPLSDTGDDKFEGWAEITTFAHPTIADPPFLATADRDEAAAEVTSLRKIPPAADYFSQQALAWHKLHPRDPRTPELLGQAFRVERNAVTDKATSELAHQLFLVLHRSYPNDHWTQRYRSWE